MTGDEMERAIDFLLQGQANHEARLGALTDTVRELAEKVGGLTESVGGLTEKTDQLTQQVAETNRIVQLHSQTQTQFIQIVTGHIEAQVEINASLREAIVRMDARLDRADARINQTDASVNRTYERLDRIEALVERYLEGRNNAQG